MFELIVLSASKALSGITEQRRLLRKLWTELWRFDMKLFQTYSHLFC
jgi:hypothetical protein